MPSHSSSRQVEVARKLVMEQYFSLYLLPTLEEHVDTSTWNSSPTYRIVEETCGHDKWCIPSKHKGPWHVFSVTVREWEKKGSGEKVRLNVKLVLHRHPVLADNYVATHFPTPEFEHHDTVSRPTPMPVVARAPIDSEGAAELGVTDGGTPDTHGRGRWFCF